MQKNGIRFLQEETIQLGEYSGENVRQFDYFCSKNNEGEGSEGYVLPYNALECLDNHNCIGVIFYVGQHPEDQSEYDKSGIGEDKCHGYVIALTNADPGNGSDQVTWSDVNNTETYMNTEDNTWNLFSNSELFHKALEDNHLSINSFMAFKACDDYGKSGWHKSLAAPKNTTGWLLPAPGPLSQIGKNAQDIAHRIKVIREENEDENYKYQVTSEKFSISFSHDKLKDYYWSSSESVFEQTVPIYEDVWIGKDKDGKDVYEKQYKGEEYRKYSSTARILNGDEVGALLKSKTSYVRPVLAF